MIAEVHTNKAGLQDLYLSHIPPLAAIVESQYKYNMEHHYEIAANLRPSLKYSCWKYPPLLAKIWTNKSPIGKPIFCLRSGRLVRNGLTRGMRLFWVYSLLVGMLNFSVVLCCTFFCGSFRCKLVRALCYPARPPDVRYGSHNYNIAEYCSLEVSRCERGI